MNLEKKLKIVCYGSFCPEETVATAAFMVEDQCLREMGRGYCRLTGTVPEVGPYQAELGGIHMVLHVLQEICSQCRISKG